MSECHGHHAPPTRQLSLTLGLVAVYFLAELIGGLWTGSLALLADAGHMFSDLAALGLSLFAAWLALQQPSEQRTYGYHRAEILAALANGVLLLGVSFGIIYESWERLQHPHEILAGPMLWIAIGGLVINLVSLKVLHGGHQHNMNLRGAWLHVMGDTLGSVGVIVAAWLVWQFGWVWADPVASAVVCVLVMYSSWNLIRDAVDVLMEHAPRDIDMERLRQQLLVREEVQDVHCLHLWTIASGMRAMSAHIVVNDDNDVLAGLQNHLLQEYGFEHVTLQLEVQGRDSCALQSGGDCLHMHSHDTESHSHKVSTSS